jgi:hypothetical protein
METKAHNEEYKIKEYVGLPALQDVKTLWEQWQHHPNADFDFFSTIVKSRPLVINPIVLLLFKNNMPIALAAGRLEKEPLPISFGYLTISKSPRLVFTIVYGGLMGTWDKEGSSVLLNYLRTTMMPHEKIDAVHFAAMRSEHPVYCETNRIVPFLMKDIGLKNNIHWWLDRPETFEAFQKRINSKHRSQLRNKEKKLIEFTGGALETKVFKTPEDVDIFCETAETIAQATYLRGLGQGFYHNQEMRNRLELASSKNWMRGFVLYANKKPCAFWLGTLYQGIFYLDYTGFNADLKDFAAGQILFIKMVESLCTDKTVKAIDFGFGDAVYKQRYGDSNFTESDLFVFRNTMTMILLNLTRKTAALVRIVAEQTLKRFDLLARIKKHWRLSAEKKVIGNSHAEATND